MGDRRRVFKGSPPIAGPGEAQACRVEVTTRRWTDGNRRVFVWLNLYGNNGKYVGSVDSQHVLRQLAEHILKSLPPKRGTKDPKKELAEFRLAANRAIERIDSMGVPKLAYRELAEVVVGKDPNW